MEAVYLRMGKNMKKALGLGRTLKGVTSGLERWLSGYCSEDPSSIPSTNMQLTTVAPVPGNQKPSHKVYTSKTPVHIK